MRDKRRKTPGISLSAAGRHTRLAPGHAGVRKSRDALLAQDRPAQRSKKSAVVERAFQPFCCCGWAWEERYLPLSQALTCRLGAER